MQNVKTKLAVALASATPLLSFAAGEDTVTQVQAAITSNMASAVAIVTAAGLALIGLAFVGFVLRKGKRAANGRI